MPIEEVITSQEADAQAPVQHAVFFAVANLLNLEVDLLFFDTTSTYFERDEEEDAVGRLVEMNQQVFVLDGRILCLAPAS
jgi:hypothetical protein